MNKLICESIKNKKIIEFLYEGHKRIVEPHCYGIRKDSRNEVLCAFQIGGYSSSGKVPFWRLYIISKISNLKMTEETFSEPREGYKKGDRRMSSIYCEI